MILAFDTSTAAFTAALLRFGAIRSTLKEDLTLELAVPAFLDLPQVFFWAMLPLQLYGMVSVWRRKKMTGRFMVIYFVMMTLLYGAFPTLQGPRHRVQIDGLIVIFQYVGILALVRGRFRKKRRYYLTEAQPPPGPHERMHHGTFPVA